MAYSNPLMRNLSIHTQLVVGPYWRHAIRCLLLLLLTTTSIAVLAARPNFGATAYPIWSELTYFERSVVGDLSKSQSGDPEALLALFLLASGSREYSDFETVQKRIEAFIGATNKLIVNRDNQWLVGQILNREMHQTFFLQPGKAAANGYAVEQSRLMGIFETAEFNCISASLLYAVLARHYGLDPLGVVLPSHAFIQLNLADGREIDVETTSPGGYDQVHDAEFYQRNKDNAAVSGLTAASLDDYRKRERVSLNRLAARNMLNQHTAEQRMDDTDGFRLAEISALIDPSYSLAQEKRVYFYNREIHTLITEQDWSSLRRLFNTTYTRVLADAKRHAGSQNLQRGIQMYLAGAMLAYAQMGDIEPTLEAMGELLSRDWNLADAREELESRVTSAIGLLLGKLAEQQKFDEGLLVLSLTEGHLSSPTAWPKLTAWFYTRWAEHYWQQKRWADVISTLQDFQQMPREFAGDSKHPLELITAAQFNWVLELTDAQDFAAAGAVVEHCETQFNATQVCLKAKKLYRERLQLQQRPSKAH